MTGGRPYHIKIDAGSHYREEVIGRTTNAVISRELLELENTIVRNTYGRFAKFCENVDDPDRLTRWYSRYGSAASGAASLVARFTGAAGLFIPY